MQVFLVSFPSNLELVLAIDYLISIQSNHDEVLALLCLRSGGGLDTIFRGGSST